MKTLLLALTSLFITTSLNAQIANGDMEGWTNGNPTDWLYDGQPGTNNWVTQIGEGDPATTNSISGAAAAGGTGISTILETKDAVGPTMASMGVSKIPGMLVGRWAASGNPADFFFDYKVAPAPGDTAIVWLTFYDVDTLEVAYTGAIFTDLDATSSWTPMSLPVNIVNANVITMVECYMTSSYSDDGSPVTGSTLSVDNFMVTGTNGVQELDFNVSVYPNPVNDVLNFNLMEGARQITVMGLDGKLLYSSEADVNIGSIDVTSLTPGVYFFEVTSENGELTRETFIKR